MQIKIQGSRDIPILRSWADALIEDYENANPLVQGKFLIASNALRSFFGAMPPVYVNMYLEDRAKGGSEEGDWYYNCGTPADDWVSEPIYCGEVWGPAMPEEVRIKTMAKDLRQYFDAIYTEIGRAKMWEIENNEGREEINSVNSRGRFRVQVEHDEARAYPEHIPHYE